MFDQRKALGIFLIVVGGLFLLANNNLLWFGWEVLWPVVPFIIGLAMMGMYRARRKPRQLFVGTLLLQFSTILFLFTSGIVAWQNMSALWPLFPLALGISIILFGVIVEDHASPLIAGFTFVGFAVVALLFSSGKVESRAAEPIMRFWPLLLVAAGGAIVWRARKDARDALANTTPIGVTPKSESESE